MRIGPSARECALVAALLSLAGCAGLPSLVPDLARHSNSTVQVEGPGSPLSAAQSKAILDRLQARGKATDVLERHLAIEEGIAGSPLTPGNKVVLLQDGPATYRAMFAVIEAARDHINMETYIFDDDEVGQRFARALIDKQRQGVQVNHIRDGAGTVGTPEAFFERLTASGINVLEFNPINPAVARKEWELNQRDHRKLLIVDGRIAFLGGINISSVYSGGSFAWSSGAPAKATPAKNYFPRAGTPGRQVVRAIASSPEESHSRIYATLLSAIGNAETSVRVTSAYFAPDPQLLAVLEAAAQRGVDVTLILPGETDSWLVLHAGRAHYDRLLRAGVKIHERRGVSLHSKTALVDGVWATVSSTNLDWRSFLHNYELNAVVLGTEFGAQVQAMFDKDLAASDPVTLEQWQRRTLDSRAKEIFARMGEYWL